MMPSTGLLSLNGRQVRIVLMMAFAAPRRVRNPFATAYLLEHVLAVVIHDLDALHLRVHIERLGEFLNRSRFQLNCCMLPEVSMMKMTYSLSTGIPATASSSAARDSKAAA